jgi:low affinity Fe/Cu permease
MRYKEVLKSCEDRPMDRLFTQIANRIAAFVGQPIAFIAALALIIGWAATGPVFGYSDTWQLVVNTTTTIVTFLIVFLIQNSQNRDAAAIQGKLDELIRAIEGARNQFIGIEHLTERELESIRAALEAESRENADSGVRHQAMQRLLSRL